ncbi:hypothetical protein B0J12DRAFT_778670, partial [Macrophomina phaseolina]
MADRSRSEIIKSEPIGDRLDAFRNSFRSTCENLGIPSSLQALDHIGRLKDLALDVILALLALPASRRLRSRSGGKNLLDDLSRLNLAVNSDEFDLERIKPLLDAVLRREPDERIWDRVYDAVAESTPPPRPASFPQTPSRSSTGNLVNSSELRKNIDEVLKKELGPIYVGIPGFYEAFFGRVAGLDATAREVFHKCRKGRNPLYSEKSGWRDWPESAGEMEVLSWFAKLTDHVASFANQRGPAPKTRRRPLAQPNKPLDGSTAERKLDVGFVDDPKARETSKCHWSQILVPGELKNNPGLDTVLKTWLHLGTYAREVLAAQDTRRFVLGFTLCGSIMRLWEFDRVGCIASPPFDINKDGLRFVSVVLGYLRMDEEQLGFDPTILKSDSNRYIEIVRNGQTERLIIDKLIKRTPCVAGRATTCWKAHRDGDESRRPLVIKDSWQYPEREEEGKLLREATKKEVVNVARYYHHETVRVRGEEDDVCDRIRNGLDIIKAKNFQRQRSMILTSRSQVQNGASQSSSTSRKRSSSHTDASLPPSKRTRSSSPTIAVTKPLENRVHRRVIVQDYGKPIYKASSRAALCAAMEGCIEGYESLHGQASMLQRDVSKNNLMINEDDDNPSWTSFLIDLDLAVDKEREGVSGARGMTGTRAFMAIGVLLEETHSFMHDLESFFWVLFWICIHYNGPNEERVVPRFEKWNYVDTEELAGMKLGIVADEGIFHKTIKEHFTEYYQPLIPWVNRLRREVFP